MLRCGMEHIQYTIIVYVGIQVSDPIHLKVKLIWHLSGL